MNPRVRAAIAGAIALSCLVGAWRGWTGYRSRRDALDAQIAALSRTRDRQEAAEMAGRAALRRDLERIAGGTLGRSEETVNAALRTALNEMLAHAGLGDTTVSTRAAEPRRNPAAQARATEFNTRTARDRVDFYTVTATVAGKGTLEEATRLLAMLEAQPWTVRVESFSLRPAGKDRERVELNAAVSTLFMPEIGPSRAPDERVWIDVGEEALDPVRSVLARNIFTEPPAGPLPAPPVEASASASAPSEPAGAPAYHEWRVTGVASGRAGPELWLLNSRTQETRMLPLGAALLGAEFVGTAGGERARLRIGSDVFEISLGSSLADRAPAAQ